MVITGCTQQKKTIETEKKPPSQMTSSQQKVVSNTLIAPNKKIEASPPQPPEKVNVGSESEKAEETEETEETQPKETVSISEPKTAEPIPPNGKPFKIDTSRRGYSKGDDGSFSLIAKEGDWVYVSDVTKKVLFKMKSDGSEKQKIAEGATYSNLNVLDGWIYFSENTSGIWKMRTDGSERVKLTSDRVYAVHVIDNYVYYTAYDLSINRRMRTDGTEVVDMTKRGIYNTIYTEEYIYYNLANVGLIRQNYEGNSETKVLVEVGVEGQVEDEWYFDDLHGLRRVNLNTGETKTFSEELISTLLIVDDWLFYSLDQEGMEESQDGLYYNGSLQKVKLDGSETHQVLDFTVWHIYSVGDEWLYYYPLYDIYKVPMDEQILRRIKVDGTCDEPVRYEGDS